MTTPDDSRPGKPPADTSWLVSPEVYAPATPSRRFGPPAMHRPPTGPTVVGEPVDLAHELKQLRRQLYVVVAVCGVTMFFALFAMLFSGYVAYYLFRFIDALQRAFG